MKDEEEKTFTEFLIKHKRHRKNRNDFNKSYIKQSNSDTNFILSKEKELRNEVEEDIRIKSKTMYKSIAHNHKHSSHCKYCKGFHKILKKDRSDLSTYIENNLSFLRLLGNQRYNKNSPFLFVEDQRNKIPERKMGLVPIPVKKNRTKSVVNKNKLYNLQRRIVMVRRYQYGRKNFFPTVPNNSYDVTLIQKWWKKMTKIILIQKYFRGYFIRKQVSAINNLHKFMNKFEYVVIRIRKEKFLRNLIMKTTFPKKRKPIKGNYLTKQKNLFDNSLIDNIIFIQKHLRKFKAKIIYNKLLREQKYFVANKNKSFFTKKNYNIKGLYEKIYMLQYNIKKFLIYKKYFSYKNMNKKGIGTFYIEKNYIDEYSMKIINFYNLMVHGLRLIAMKKIRSDYKYVNEYNKDDINKVIFIQRFFLKRYYNKHGKKLKWNKKIKKIGIVDKLRLKDNLKQIKLIQNLFRKYNLKITKFKSKLIRNKPISSSVIKKEKENQLNIKPIKKGVSIANYKKKYNSKFNQKYNIYNKNKEQIEENNYHSNGRLINNICFYSKEYKINQMNEILYLQTKIYSYLFLKNLRKKRKLINKKNFNTQFLITKINNNENECIEKIKLIQKIFKREYKIMKNNLLENFNTKNSTESKDSKKEPKQKSFKIPKSPLKGYTYPTQNYINLNNKKNKYYTKFKKDDENIKSRNYNLSIPKDKKTLREKLNKNKTPKRATKGNYISKKRVEKYSEENYLTFNKKIFHQINKNQCNYSKVRLYDNNREIIKIQNNWRKKLIYNNIIQKPLFIDFEKDKLINSTIDQSETLFIPKKTYNNITPSKIIKITPIINNKNKNKPPSSRSNSNRKNISQNKYDNDEYPDNRSIGKSIYNLSNKKFSSSYNDENVNNYLSKSSYILKTRKINLLNYILLLQKNIRNYISKMKFITKSYIDISLISKCRLDIITYNKFLKYIEESKTIIKIEKSNNTTDYNLNKLVNYADINFITKIRYFNYITDIEKIQRNWRIKLENKIIYKKVKQRKKVVTKLRKRNNEEKIFFIQKIIKERIFKKNDEKSSTVSRKAILTNSLYNKRRYSKNKVKRNENKGNKSKINKKLRQNMDNYLSNNNLNKLVNKKMDSNSESSNYDSNSVKSFNKKDFSYAKINYITKINKFIIYKKQLNIIGNFISKQYKIENRKKKDYSFIHLLHLFIIKNTQEYFYYYLKYNNKKTFSYPVYPKTLQRVLKYFQASEKNLNTSLSNPDNQENNSTGEKIKKLFIKIFPSLFSQKSPSLLISSITSESEKLLLNTNIYNTIEPDFINFLNDFSKYDKHLSNSIFIETRLKNTKLIRTNIFTIIKFLDDEYTNLIYGKYCFKCFLDNNKCLCEINKDKKDDEFYFSEIDNIMDIEFDPFYFTKHENEYDSTKWKDISIKRKPKAEEIYEDPITHLIIKTKDNLNEGQKITVSKVNSINNTNESYFGTITNSSFNSKILNKIKNDLDNESSMNNSRNIAKIKAIYHQSTGKKKENLILIKNNDY